jgi:hypothetical protein
MAQIFTTFPHELTGITGAKHSAQLLTLSEIVQTLRVPVFLRFMRFRHNTQSIHKGKFMHTFKGVAGAARDLPNDESSAAQIRNAAVLTEKQLADWLGLSEKSLRRQRCQGIGFPYLKLGSGRNASVRYYLPHVLDHLEKCKRVPSVRAAF